MASDDGRATALTVVRTLEGLIPHLRGVHERARWRRRLDTRRGVRGRTEQRHVHARALPDLRDRALPRAL